MKKTHRFVLTGALVFLAGGYALAVQCVTGVRGYKIMNADGSTYQTVICSGPGGNCTVSDGGGAYAANGCGM